ncbi:hypothetical protein GGF39_002043 [Coemansia sp. RSA 1721]|nr:hypothetical protein GGF39_002043 [Coemansia sp. RSA 1721]
MEHVYQHLQEIVKEIYQSSKIHGSTTPPPSGGLSVGLANQAGPELEYMVGLLGQEHMLSAMQLVDRGIACLTSGTRCLFRIGRQGLPGEDLCFCILPGRYCSSCSADNAHAASSKSFQQQDALPCTHITAVLLAVAQSRCTYEELSAQEMATALFTIT